MIHLTNIDDYYSNVEIDFINNLYFYDINELDKDALLILKNLLVKELSKKINSSTLTMDNGLSGYNIYTTGIFHLFFFDITKIKNHEIFEYYSKEDFLIFFTKVVSKVNSILNNRILTLDFPYTLFNEVTINGNDFDKKSNILKTDIFDQYFCKLI